MNYKVTLTTEQIMFLTALVREYLDDEEETGLILKPDLDDVEKHKTRLVFYKSLHKKLSNKVYK
jgi:hypothetical protein